MKQGKIIKGIAGFYYVHTSGTDIYECRAKGIFRNENVKPLVGDDVHIEVISEEEMTGNVIEILPRKNELPRPNVANVDQALVIFALAAPKPNVNLLDRMLVQMEQQDIPAVICMNKTDLAEPRDIEKFREIYRPSGYPIFFFSAKTGDGTEQVREQLTGKTSVVAGPSGGGKSTLINLLAPHAQMETGELSKKIQRGKNTTRHAELITLDDSSFIVDTPGFSSLSIEGNASDGKYAKGGPYTVDTDSLKEYFPEFVQLEDQCRFRGCSHLTEPGCAVRAAVDDGRISMSRYTSYRQIYQELKENRPY